MEIKFCKRCEQDWCYRGSGRMVRCGRCKSPYWDREKQDAGRANQEGAKSSDEVHSTGGRVDQKRKSAKPAVVRKQAIRSVAKVEPGPDKGVGGDAKAVNVGIPADADVPSHVGPTYGGLTRSGDPTTPAIKKYYVPARFRKDK